MKWLDAMDWAAGLIIDGVSGWRLPGGPMASGYNQTASEMGNMFYTVLGGEAGKDIADIHDATNYALFENVQGYGGYWSGVDSTPDFLKWGFAFDDGDQPVYYSGNNSHVWAVRSGDVGGNPVPAPGRVSVARGGVVGLGRC